jgi:hypothetical protein
MKIAEIEAGGKSIPELLKTYFSINRHYNIIDGDLYNGIIDVDGNVSLIKRISKLPVQFGNVSGDFNCDRNKLTTLQGAPKSVGGDFNCDRNQLTTLQGAPSSVGGYFNCSYSDNMPLLRLLLIKDVKKISLHPENDIVQNILNKYLGQGRGGALQCAAELVKAGYKGNARM